MMNIGYNNRWVRLIKDILFVALACWIITRGSILAYLIGALGVFWYGRDAFFQIKALWQEKHYKGPEAPKEGPTTQAPQDNGKVTITNLSDAKEVDYTKE
ncbi:MAG: hypothetical protein IK052_04630 [Bacteroidales bacterium]|nr:hypothetical protein [Bacteroidales bacterium]